MGVQGSGKGTQAKLLATDFDLIHIGVGDIFRWHIQSHTKLAARIRRHMAAGELGQYNRNEACAGHSVLPHFNGAMKSAQPYPSHLKEQPTQKRGLP